MENNTTDKPWASVLAAALSALTFGLFGIVGESARAHAPHDLIFELDVSPTYREDQTLFIVVRRNVMKSTDGGKSWSRIVNGLSLRSKSTISSIAVSRQSRDVVFLSSPREGVYKSVDGGASWSAFNHGLKTARVHLIFIHPTVTDTVFAAHVDGGLYESRGSRAWRRVIDEDRVITSLGYLPSDDRPLMIAGTEDGDLLQSEDQRPWSPLAALPAGGAVTAIAADSERIYAGTADAGVFIVEGTPGAVPLRPAQRGLTDLAIRSLAVAPGTAEKPVLFAVTWHDGLFRSVDGARSWQRSDTGLTRDSQADDAGLPHFYAIRLSDAFGADGTAFIGGFDGLFKSTDGAESWSQISTLSARTIVSISLSPDYGSDATVAVSTYLSGVFISRDAGESWIPSDRGLALAPDSRTERLYEVCFSPAYGSDKTLFVASRDAFFKSDDGGRRWQRKIHFARWAPTPRLEAFKKENGLYDRGKARLVISPDYGSDRTIFLATREGDFFKSTDGGENFSFIINLAASTGQGEGLYHLAVSPDFAVDRTLLVGTPARLYVSTDAGDSWRRIADPRPRSTVTALALSTNFDADRTVFVGRTTGLLKLNVTTDDWRSLADATTFGEGGYVESLAVSPAFQKDRTVLVSVRGMGLFAGRDENFEAVDGRRLIEENNSLSQLWRFHDTAPAIAFSPAYGEDDTIFGFSDTRVFKSTDRGRTWRSMEP